MFFKLIIKLFSFSFFLFLTALSIGENHSSIYSWFMKLLSLLHSGFKFYKKKIKKNLPSKLAHLSLIEEIFAYWPDCPNNPKIKIFVGKCDSQSNCIKNCGDNQKAIICLAAPIKTETNSHFVLKFFFFLPALSPHIFGLENL